MKKLLLVLLLAGSYLFAGINLQTASKAELMSISGIGAKKADAIMKYRKLHKLKSVNDLLKVKGIGKNIVKNVKGNITNKVKSVKKSVNSKKSKAKAMKKNSMKSMKKMQKKVSKKKLSL